MFTIDDTITDLELKKKNMVKVFFSMNNHQVATPEMMLEAARSYIMFFRESQGKLSSYIELHLLATGRKLFYVYSSNPFPDGERSEIEDEALAFVEGLGALIDTIDFSDLSAEEKERWIEKHEIFAQPSKPSAAAEEEETAARERTGGDIPHEAQQSPAETAAPVEMPLPVQPAPPERPAPQPQQPVPSRQNTPTDRGQHVESNTRIHEAPQPVQAPPIQPQAPQEHQSGYGYPDEIEEQSSAPPVDKEDFPPAPERRPEQQQAALKKVSSTGTEKRSEMPFGRSVESSGAPGQGKQEVVQKTAKTSVVKPSKPMTRKEASRAAGVVTRDREALARLLTSF